MLTNARRAYRWLSQILLPADRLLTVVDRRTRSRPEALWLVHDDLVALGEIESDPLPLRTSTGGHWLLEHGRWWDRYAPVHRALKN
ncbi:hypothetical protein [Bradyrhizobium sp. NC92]|uniref:hypothetical protein n=1 Tax=Bradyrhizobium sp. (strain NC92) TaxID=55395 RepID=UPI0021AA177B|nr:hypothetical protein [Bradyrhizobium sp. NC92]UWU67963.1 hypothetical protein N2602_33070 [Bradyrhizobium sp. NC92]